MNNNPIIITQKFKCSSARLWQAMTKVEEMREWFFENIPDFDAKIGFETRFNVDAGQRQFMHVWKLIDVKERELIKYCWSYDGYAGVGYVTFLITEEDDLCKLTLISEGLESFKPHMPEFTRENCTLGWKYFITKRLKSYLANSTLQQ